MGLDMEKETKELFSRRKMLRISQDDIKRLFYTKGQTRIIMIGGDLPEDTMVTGVCYSLRTNSFEVQIVSKYFPVVNDGCIAPILEGTDTREIKELL